MALLITSEEFPLPRSDEDISEITRILEGPEPPLVNPLASFNRNPRMYRGPETAVVESHVASSKNDSSGVIAAELKGAMLPTAAAPFVTAPSAAPLAPMFSTGTAGVISPKGFADSKGLLKPATPGGPTGSVGSTAQAYPIILTPELASGVIPLFGKPSAPEVRAIDFSVKPTVSYGANRESNVLAVAREIDIAKLNSTKKKGEGTYTQKQLSDFAGRLGLPKKSRKEENRLQIKALLARLGIPN